MSSTDADIWMEFNRLWGDASKEIFRLQLLDSYSVESEKEAFALYKQGKHVGPSDEPGFKDWLSNIEKRKAAGVRIINVNVASVPLSEYMKFMISTYLLKTTEKGKEDMLVERETVPEARSATDFWMFDRKVVIFMRYDKEGCFLGTEKAKTDPKTVQKCVALEDAVIKQAKPLAEFLRNYHVDLGPKKVKSANH